MHWVGQELQPQDKINFEVMVGLAGKLEGNNNNKKKCLKLEFFGGQVYCPRV